MAGGLFLVVAALAAQPQANACVELVQALVAGQAPLAADLRPAPCGKTRAAFGYDPITGLARARRDLALGEIVRAPPPTMLAAVRKGQSLRLTTSVGPVTIERTVIAQRGAARGRPVWVRGGDGVVFMTSAASVTP